MKPKEKLLEELIKTPRLPRKKKKDLLKRWPRCFLKRFIKIKPIKF